AAPVMLTIALTIRLTSRGPVLLRQERMGLDGRAFTMLKFRTMRVDAETESGPVWTRADDPRRTPIGAWLRHFSLDELPQLVTGDRLRVILLGAFAVGLAFSITLAESALAALALRLAWRLVSGRARPADWPLALPFAAWTVASLVAAGLSNEPLSSVVPAVKGVLLIVTFYAMLDALPDAGAADRLLSGLLVLVAIVALLGIVQVAICPG